MNKNTIIVVSGLPRSGTSLMMQILHEAGFPLLTDGLRQPDENNPQGYFEYQAVKKLKEDQRWLPLARGKVVKIVSPLLIYLPDDFVYKIIFMHRNLDEIIASQNKMLKRTETSEASGPLRSQLANHLLQIHAYLTKKTNVQLLKMDFNTLIQKPEAELKKLAVFLGRPIDLNQIKKVIRPDLYRTRISF